MNASDVTKNAVGIDPRFKSVANLKKRFSDILKNRKDVERQGTFYRLVKE